MGPHDHMADPLLDWRGPTLGIREVRGEVPCGEELGSGSGKGWERGGSSRQWEQGVQKPPSPSFLPSFFPGLFWGPQPQPHMQDMSPRGRSGLKRGGEDR